MSEIVAQDARKSSRILSILILIALFVPHSLEISRVHLPDNSYFRYSLYAVFWAVSNESGSTIAGPYSSTLFEILSVPALFLDALFLPLFISVIIIQSRFIKGITTKRSILRVIGMALIIQTFPLSALFWFQVTGLGYTQLYPLPIFHALSILSVFRHRETESMAEPDVQDLPPKHERESSIRSIVSDSIVTSCFWCVSLVFFFIGGLMVISNLLIGLSFLGLAIIIIIILVRSEHW